MTAAARLCDACGADSPTLEHWVHRPPGAWNSGRPDADCRSMVLCATCAGRWHGVTPRDRFPHPRCTICKERGVAFALPPAAMRQARELHEQKMQLVSQVGAYVHPVGAPPGVVLQVLDVETGGPIFKPVVRRVFARQVVKGVLSLKNAERFEFKPEQLEPAAPPASGRIVSATGRR